MKKLEDLFDDLEDALNDEIDDIDTELGNVKQALSDEAEARATLGAHNILPLTLANLKAINVSGVWSNNVYTYHDITFTVDIDDKGAVTDIKVNGTNTALNTDLILCQGNLADFADCLLSGCPSGLTGISINAELSVSPWTSFAEDKGNGATIGSGIGANCKIFIRVKPNVAPSNKYFYPMIRLASDTDPTYQPYAMTNREFTEKQSIVTSTYYTKYGNIVQVHYRANIATDGEEKTLLTGLPKPISKTHRYYYAMAGQSYTSYNAVAEITGTGDLKAVIYNSSGLITGITVTLTINVTYICE